MRELLVAGRRKVHELWLVGDADDAPELAEIVRSPRQRGAHPTRAGRPDRAAGPHRTRRRAWSRSRRRSRPPTSTTLLADPRAFLVALDGVTDPQNLGAVMRTAETAGATGIVLPRHRAGGLTPGGRQGRGRRASSTCRSRSSPASPVRSTARSAPACGAWGSTPTATSRCFDARRSPTQPLVLVLGAEGRGLSRLARDALRRDRVDPDARSHRVAQRERGGRGRVHRDRASIARDSLFAHAGLAQVAEHFSCKEDVVGSNPTPGSKRDHSLVDAEGSRRARSADRNGRLVVHRHRGVDALVAGATRRDASLHSPATTTCSTGRSWTITDSWSSRRVTAHSQLSAPRPTRSVPPSRRNVRSTRSPGRYRSRSGSAWASTSARPSSATATTTAPR